MSRGRPSSPASRALSAEAATTMLDAAPDGMLLVRSDGEIEYASAQAAQLFADDHLIGRHVEELLPESARERHGEHLARYLASPDRRQMGAGVSLVGRRRDGSTFDAEIALSPVTLDGETHIVAAVRDVSDRVAAEEHLHRVLHSLDASDDAVLLFDADSLLFSHVSDGAVRMLGYERAEMATMTPLDLNPAATEVEYRALVEDLLAHPDHSVRRESLLRRKDGELVPVEKLYQAAPGDDSRWIVGVARDISARLAAQEELQRRTEQLHEAHEAVALSEDRSRIARDLHDTVIQRLFGAGLRLQSTAAIATDAVRARLEGAVEEIDATIRELRSAIFSLTPKSHAPGLRNELLDVASEAGAAMGVEPRLRFDGPIDSLPPEVSRHLVPVLREALSNVAKHAHARAVQVEVTVNDEVTLRVVDDGVGADAAVLGGNGLDNLRDRAAELGGLVDLTRLEGGGTELAWTVPARPPSG